MTIVSPGAAWSSDAVSAPDPSLPAARQGFREWIVHREPDRGFAPRWWWAALSVALTAFVHAYVAWTTLGPAIGADEVGAVGAARAIAHGGGDWTLDGSGYMPGVALLLSPAWWFTDDQYLVYHIGLAIGVACAVACIWPLSLIARAAGIRSRTGAITIAAVVMLAPARTIPSNYLLSESLLLLTTAATIALAFRAVEHRTALSMGAVGAMSGLVFLAHGRGIAVTLAACMWGVLVAGKAWRLWVALVASAGVVAGASFALFNWVADDLYGGNTRVHETFDGTSTHTFTEVLGTAIGLSWYAVAAWSAIAIAGMGVILKRCPQRSGELLVALAFVPTVVLALIQLDKSPTDEDFQRLDSWIYGRYIDHLLTIAAVIGLAVLTRVNSRLFVATVISCAVAIVVAFSLVTVPQIPVGGYWTDVHVAGVSYLLSVQNYLLGRAEPWLLFSLMAIVFTALILIAARVRAAVLVLALLWGALSLAADATRIDPRNDLGRVFPGVAEPLHLLPQSEPVAFNEEYRLSVNPIVFAAHPWRIELTTVADASKHYQAIYTGMDDGSPAQYGALPIDSDFYFGTALWVFPGPTFDKLDQEGKLAHPPADGN